ncbi:uncharacterized protein C8Q71DRAFT_701799 [Rhodofomes roseus]|uniref:Uncharacterized protein n=1 Tax=Rhodofomes roseus TaxID=34475 RepID=A0ABQ8KQU3_9APHY|nr:uncharacterized protein C8Q71DRAFT_701799 [Rhodofomes roseus]KAH9840994.1 hypothetical protein C8Q71DRAFT_701799 [Rhodofomes roseus]
MVEVALVTVNLATVALESVLYGIFLVLASASVYFNVSRSASARRPRGRRCWLLDPISVGSALISLTITGHWITTIARLFDAFVNCNGSATPLEYYSTIWLSSEAAQSSFLIATLILCDSMLIYRLWVVWGYNYVVAILPMCALLGFCVAGPVAVYEQTLIRGSIFAQTVVQWVDASYGLTFARVTHQMLRRNWKSNSCCVGRTYIALVNALYTVIANLAKASTFRSYAIFFLITYRAKSNVQFFTIDTLCPVTGIAFMLINVRVGLGWAARGASLISSSPSGSSSQAVRGGTVHSEMAFAMRPVTVDVITVIHQDMGDDLEESRVKSDYNTTAL